jgi:sulfotransferase family protein
MESDRSIRVTEPRVTPVFLLSLPRSGSTLVQRVLGAHRDVATASEPWVLLPQIYALRTEGVRAEYGHAMAATATQDFWQHLPGGRADYLAELRGFALRLYGRAAGGRRYFLDKTPRYHLIVADLFELFPEARFVFLWRQPLSVVASMVDTWARGRWNIHRWAVDLFDGLGNLVEAYEAHAADVYAVRYEDLVAGSNAGWEGLFEFLGLDFDPAILSRFHEVRLTGRWGDATGLDRRDITAESLDKWQGVLASPYRKSWARDYLQWIGSHRLAVMGYDKAWLEAELAAVASKPARLPSDLARSAYGRMYCRRHGFRYRG